MVITLTLTLTLKHQAHHCLPQHKAAHAGLRGGSLRQGIVHRRPACSGQRVVLVTCRGTGAETDTGRGPVSNAMVCSDHIVQCMQTVKGNAYCIWCHCQTYGGHRWWSSSPPAAPAALLYDLRLTPLRPAFPCSGSPGPAAACPGQANRAIQNKKS